METATAIKVSPVNMSERKDLGIRPGDTVRVHQKIEDKGKTRIQIFEGLVLARKHGSEAGATFTVRKVVDGIGVEKIFPLYAPMIDKIEIVRRAKVRRAKLYYIREKVAREIKRQMRRMQMMTLSTESGIEVAARADAEEAKRVEEEAAAAEAKAAEEAAAKEAEEAAKKAEAEATAEAETKEEIPVEEAKEDETKVAEGNSPEVSSEEKGEETKTA